MMARFIIHAYPVVRVTHPPVEADSLQEALKQLMRGEDEFLTYRRVLGEDWEDEITAYLVDVEGDEDYRQSTWFTPDGEIDRTMHPPEPLPDGAMKVFTFKVELEGKGQDADEAWLNAIEPLSEDAGIPDQTTITARLYG
jgi:hypothetical protein